MLRVEYTQFTLNQSHFQRSLVNYFGVITLLMPVTFLCHRVQESFRERRQRMRKLLRFVNISVNCEADYCVIFAFLIKESGYSLLVLSAKGPNGNQFVFQ